MTESRSRSALAARTFAFTVLVPGTIVIAVPWLMLRSELGAFRIAPGPILALAGALAFVAGALLYASAAREFVSAGHGTPSTIGPPDRLVTTGPYGWIRNPIYAAVVLAVVGEGLFFGSPSLLGFALMLLGLLHARVVVVEEPGLARRFGDGYERYRSRVPRWLPRRTSS